jgi:hypothetical protein
MDPTFPDLYKLFGLTPLEEFASSGSRPTGATTWMSVAALHYLSQRSDVCIICRNVTHAHDTSDRILDWGRKLSLQVRQRGADFAILNNGARLKWKVGKPDVVNVIGFQGVVLNDWRWEERLARRIDGPYAMILRIVKNGDDYIGVAEDQEEVMVFTEAGASDFLAENPGVRAEGWTPTPTRTPIASLLKAIEKIQHESWSRR